MQNEMGYRWGQLERSVAGAFQNGALNMHGWSCIESWLQNDLVTTDIPFLSQAPIIGLISAARVQLAVLTTYIYSQLLFSTSCDVLARLKTEPLQCITVRGSQCLLMQAWQRTALPFRAAATILVHCKAKCSQVKQLVCWSMENYSPDIFITISVIFYAKT